MLRRARSLRIVSAIEDVPLGTVPQGDETIMRFTTSLAAACVAWLGATVLASTVTYDYDRTANFSKFRTYTWARGNPLKDELNHQRIVRAVETQLAARGFTKVGAGHNPDVLVAYHTAMDQSLQINAFGSGGWGPYGLGGSRMGSARADKVTVGSVVVDMVEAADQKMVWRGTASQDLDPRASAEKKDKGVNKAIEKMFKHYPPKP
jgi:Domain of unknown function (DUF4136)